MKTRTRIGVLPIALLVALAACGGAGESSETTSAAPDTTAAVDTPTTTGAAPDTTAAPDPGGDGDGLSGLSATCLEATQAMSAAVSSYSTGIAGAMGGTLDGEELEQVAGQLEAMAEAAPDEIKDDLQVIAEELGAFYAALAETGYTGSGTPTPDQIAQLEALSDAIDQEAFDTASDNITAWFEANCD